MAATIASLVSDTKHNRLSLIGSLTEQEVLLVWDKVAQFVETLMMQQKGVTIGGLGTFTFSKRRIEVGNNRAILIQRPVFVLSERFKQTHSLHCVKKHASGQVPMHTLNFTLLSNETGVSRELAEGAVREVLQALSRAVAAKKSIDFDLKDIGRLTIHDRKAKMSFFREFVFRLDGCCHMEGVFRTNTDDGSICSIMSNPHTPSSRPSTILSLPRIVQPMATEEDGEMNLSLSCSGSTSEDASPSSYVGDSSPYESTRLSRQLERDLTTIAEEDEEEEEVERERDTLKAGVFTVDKNCKFSSKSMEVEPTDDKATKSSKSTRQTLVPTPAMLVVSRGSQRTVLARQPSSDQSKQRFSTREQGTEGSTSGSRTATSSGSCSCSFVPTSVSRPSTCSHKNTTGQELCYLCHQRAVRNVPIDLSIKKAATEKRYNDTLHEYQRRSELLAMARTQADKTKRRLLDQETASFNLTRAGRTKKQKEVKSSEMDPSYIFCERMVTPAPHASQQRYCRELDSQVESKLSRQEREMSEAEESGREEQKRLTRELAAYEKLHRQMKVQAVEEYKAALNEQVTLKLVCQQSTDAGCAANHCMIPSLLPGRDPETVSRSQSSRSLKVPPSNTLRPFTPTHPHNTHTNGCSGTTCNKTTKFSSYAPPTDHTHHKQPHPVFGVNQASPAEVSERERAKAFFLEQLAMVEEKQKRTRGKALKTLQEDAEMLKATKHGLKEDLHREKGRRVQARQALEEEWLASMRDKQRKLLEELHRAKEQGIRLHQQCERYLRCKQCQRKQQNAGKSNILHETRYISGSRLMV